MVKPTSQLQLRDSERRLMRILRAEGPKSKAELARLSGMSAQGAAVVMDRLQDIGVVIAGQKLRGRVGQPSTPLMINPDSALTLGIYAARDEAALCVCDLGGTVVHRQHVRAGKRSLPDSILAASREIAAAHLGLQTVMIASRLQATEGTSIGGAARPLSRGFGKELRDALVVPVSEIEEVSAACLSSIGQSPDDLTRMTLHIDLADEIRASVFDGGSFLGASSARRSGFGSVLVPGNARDGSGFQTIAGACSLGRFEDMLDDEARSLDDAAQAGGAFAAWCAEASDALVFAMRSVCGAVPIEHVTISAALPDQKVAAFRDCLTSRMGPIAQMGVTLKVAGANADSKAYGAASGAVLALLGFIDTAGASGAALESCWRPRRQLLQSRA